MRDFKRTAIGHSNGERPKRLQVQSISELLGGHKGSIPRERSANLLLPGLRLLGGLLRLLLELLLRSWLLLRTRFLFRPGLLVSTRLLFPFLDEFLGALFGGGFLL